jgi:hypothetical protein
LNTLNLLEVKKFRELRDFRIPLTIDNLKEHLNYLIKDIKEKIDELKKLSFKIK